MVLTMQPTAKQMCARETEEEGAKQQSVKIMADMARKITAKGRTNAQNNWWVSELIAGCWLQKRGFTQTSDGTVDCMKM